VRAVTDYVSVCRSVAVLEIMNNKMTALGCEFVSRIMHPTINAGIRSLKLDHNPFGSAGMLALANGLALNKALTSLSLTYCSIDQAGARGIFEILIY